MRFSQMILFLGLLFICYGLPLSGRYSRQLHAAKNVGPPATGFLNVVVEGSGVAAGQGSASDIHTAEVTALGPTSDSTTPYIDIGNAGLSDVSNVVAIIQVTAVEDQQGGGFQAAGISQDASASDVLIVDAGGQNVHIDATSQADILSSGASSVAATIGVIGAPALPLGYAPSK